MAARNPHPFSSPDFSLHGSLYFRKRTLRLRRATFPWEQPVFRTRGPRVTETPPPPPPRRGRICASAAPPTPRGSLPGAEPPRFPARPPGLVYPWAADPLRPARRDRAEPRGPPWPGHERSRMMRPCLGRCSRRRRRRRRRSGGAAAPGDPARASGERGGPGRAGCWHLALPAAPGPPVRQSRAPCSVLLHRAAPHLRPSRAPLGGTSVPALDSFLCQVSPCHSLVHLSG